MYETSSYHQEILKTTAKDVRNATTNPLKNHCQVRMQMHINDSKTQKRNMQKARKRNSDE